MIYFQLHTVFIDFINSYIYDWLKKSIKKIQFFW